MKKFNFVSIRDLINDSDKDGIKEYIKTTELTENDIEKIKTHVSYFHDKSRDYVLNILDQKDNFTGSTTSSEEKESKRIHQLAESYLDGQAFNEEDIQYIDDLVMNIYKSSNIKNNLEDTIPVIIEKTKGTNTSILIYFLESFHQSVPINKFYTLSIHETVFRDTISSIIDSNEVPLLAELYPDYFNDC